MPGRGPLVRRSYAVLGGGASLVYAIGFNPTTDTLAFIVLGFATAAALLAGPMVNDAPRAPWYLIAAVCTLFAVGAGVRPLAVAASGWQVALSDLFVLPGYALLFLGLGKLLHRRDGVRDVHATIDMLVVLLGVGSLSVTFLALPASEVPGRPLWLSLVSAVYPVLDVLLICVLVQLWFTSTRFTWALASLSAAMATLLAADFVYALLNVHGILQAPHGVDTVFAVSFLLLGITALHPSVRLLSVGQRRGVQAWTPLRMLVVAIALSVPVLLLATHRAAGPLRPGLAVTAILGTGLLLVRATTAVRAVSRVQRLTEHDATHDPLTGLPNRVHVDAWLDRRLSRGKALTLLFLDLDGFKLVNDSFGHASGDELLRAVAKRLRVVTPPGSVLARLGGDEFVLAVDQTEGDPGDLAQQLLSSLLAPFALHAAEVAITASIGIAASGRPGRPGPTGQDLIREADTAMYRAKAVGRGSVAVFDESMRSSVLERLELEQSLRQALALGQLEVHFQPVVALCSDLVVSHEALVRWTHPVRGNVPPDSFIGLAEETGLIVEIGDWVLERSLEVLAARRAAGAGSLTVAVNVAGRQLIDPQFGARVCAALRRHGLPRSALKLEITESAMLQDDVAVTRTMDWLVEAGVSLSMDDFGTGFSSLGYLRRLPVAEVKIDRSFVAGMVDSPADEEIIRAATAMAHALRLSVVAEGVETVAQRDLLARLGVDRGQGWLYGRPAPFDAYAESGSVTEPSRSSMTAAGRTSGTGSS